MAIAMNTSGCIKVLKVLTLVSTILLIGLNSKFYEILTKQLSSSIKLYSR